MIFNTWTTPPSRKLVHYKAKIMGLRSHIIIAIIITDVHHLFMIGFVSMIITVLNNRALILPLALAS